MTRGDRTGRETFLRSNYSGSKRATKAMQEPQNQRRRGTVKRYLIALVGLIVLLAFLCSCAGVVYVPEPPPAPRDEVRSPRPGPKAVWIDGHWKRAGGQWVWAPGHWVKKPKGQWVAGHWKKTPRGYKWVKGHWKP